MVPTDKYKKGVIALSRKATEINPGLGDYLTHYINKDAKFIVQLSHGVLEIDLELAREYENNPSNINPSRLMKIKSSNPEEEKHKKGTITIDTIWRRLFAEAKK